MFFNMTTTRTHINQHKFNTINNPEYTLVIIVAEVI